MNRKKVKAPRNLFEEFASVSILGQLWALATDPWAKKILASAAMHQMDIAHRDQTVHEWRQSTLPAPTRNSSGSIASEWRWHYQDCYCPTCTEQGTGKQFPIAVFYSSRYGD